MPRLIDMDEIKKREHDVVLKDGAKHRCFDTTMLYELPTVDAVPVVRCKNCKHKPTGTEIDHDLDFPDDVCPCKCQDHWYSWMPEDDFFCARGEKREEEEKRTVTFYSEGKPIETIEIGEGGNDAD